MTCHTKTFCFRFYFIAMFSVFLYSLTIFFKNRQGMNQEFILNLFLHYLFIYDCNAYLRFLVKGSFIFHFLQRTFIFLQVVIILAQYKELGRYTKTHASSRVQTNEITFSSTTFENILILSIHSLLLMPKHNTQLLCIVPPYSTMHVFCTWLSLLFMYPLKD